MLVAAPRVVGHGARMPDQPRSFLDLTARKPADRFDHLGRVAPAKSPIQLERRVADNPALRRFDSVFAIQREVADVAAVSAGGRIIWYGARRYAVPREDAVAVAVR